MKDSGDAMTPPRSTAADAAHALAKVAIGQIPAVGGAASELFQWLVTPPLERRRAEWMELVADAIREIQDKQKRTIEELTQDDRFVDAVLQATHVALRTSQQEKKRALRNAIIKVGTDVTLEEAVQQMFVSWIDELTVWHLQLLELLSDPTHWFQKRNRRPPEFINSSRLERLISEALPEFGGRRDLLEQVSRDLKNRGLADVDSGTLFSMMSATGAFVKRSTPLGDQFLRFISE